MKEHLIQFIYKLGALLLASLASLSIANRYWAAITIIMIIEVEFDCWNLRTEFCSIALVAIAAEQVALVKAPYLNGREKVARRL